MSIDNSMEPIQIPQYIDEPPTILLWSADELLPLLMGLFLGIQLQQALLFSVAGMVITYYYVRFIDRKPNGYLLHTMYWHGIYFKSTRTMPNPFIREYV